MRSSRIFFLASAMLAITSGLLSPLAKAQQNEEPIAVVSIAPLERLLKDTSYILQASSVPEIGGLVSIMANQYTQGLDRSRPIGVSVSLDGQMPVGLVFLPLSDREQFFGALGTMGIVPDDLGDGVFEIDANGQTLFAKDAGGWLFIAQTENSLSSVPTDPSTLLGDLPSRYDVAARVNVQAVPQDLREMATQQMKIGFENTMNEQGGQSDEEKEAARKAGEAQIAQLEQLMADTERVIFGWAIDIAGQRTYMDAAAQFVAGSKYAEQSNAMSDLKSDYTAFKLPGSSANFRATSEITDETDKEVAKQNLRNSLTQIEGQLDQANVSDESKELLTDLMNALVDLTAQTIDEGKFDGASSVSVADDTLRVLVGGRIADGKALEQELKKLIAGLPENASKPRVEFEYDTYQGVTLHRVTVPVKIADPGARKVFGEELKLTVGTADKAFMISLDPAGDASLKAAIDSMASAKNAASTPFEGVVELAALLRFAQAVSPNPVLDNAVKTIQEYVGKDKVQVMGSVIPRGGVYRLSIDEGVLRAIGVAAKSGAGGGGGF